MALMSDQAYFGQWNARAGHFFGRRHHLGLPGDDFATFGADAAAIEQDRMIQFPFICNRHAGGDHIPYAYRCQEAQRLASINRAGARQLGPEHSRDQAGTPHAVSDNMMKQVGFRIVRVHMRRVHVAGDGRE